MSTYAQRLSFQLGSKMADGNVRTPNIMENSIIINYEMQIFPLNPYPVYTVYTSWRTSFKIAHHNIYDKLRKYSISSTQGNSYYWYKINMLYEQRNRLHSLLFGNNRPFATNDHMAQNPPYWRASSLLFPHWDMKIEASQAWLVEISLF